MRLIDADALRDKLDLDLARWLDSAHEYKEDKSGYVAMHDAIKLVIDAPTIDAAPVVHGEWEEYDWCDVQHGEVIHHPKAGWVCNCCHFCFPKKGLWIKHYCPNCGAKMIGE